MKKIILAAVVVCAAALANAATVGWANMNLAAYNGDKYYMFVIGQKGAADVATITALLDKGTSVDSYAIGGGAVASGAATVSASKSGVELGEGSYTAFMVLFDSATPTAGTSKYIVLQGGNGGTGYSQTVASTTATINFAGGNAASMISASTWKSYGSSAAPEPTSAMLMLLGVAGLVLKRKRT